MFLNKIGGDSTKEKSFKQAPCLMSVSIFQVQKMEFFFFFFKGKDCEINYIKKKPAKSA